MFLGFVFLRLYGPQTKNTDMRDTRTTCVLGFHSYYWRWQLGWPLTLSSILVRDLPATPQDTSAQVPLATLPARRLQTCALCTSIGSAERKTGDQFVIG